VSAVAVCLLATLAFAQVPSSQHVVLIIDENTSYSEVLANMPWTVNQGALNGYASNYQSDNGGSLLDYLWLASGSCESAANCTLPAGDHDFNCNGNDCYYPNTDTTDPITDDNIFREMNNAGISWKVYAEGYTAAGGTPTTPDNNNGTSYYRRHNGATWYSDILSNVDNSASKIVDLSQLAVDLANNALPRFTIIAPDGNDDAHDCPAGLETCTQAQKLAAADTFLSTTLAPIMALSDFKPGGTGLVFITFDECGGGTDQGCGAAVYTAILGPKVLPHTVSGIAYKHENTLRTMCEALGITTNPGAAATAAAMTDFFASSGNAPVVSVAYPANGSDVNSPVALQASAYPSTGHTITGWYVYVDGKAVYTAGAVTTINAGLTISSGQHSVIVRAWDNSGAYGSQTLALTVGASQPEVNVLTPTTNSTVGSPVHVIADASPTAGHTITGWWIYVDGKGVYNAGAVNLINANVSMTNGSHTVLVRAWDNSGAYGTQTLALTIANKPAVAISTPLTGMNVLSPINVKASATPSSGHSITGWYIYVNGVAAYNAGAVTSINANVNASPGMQTLLVRAWDTSGAYGDQTLSVDVGSVAVNVSTPLNGAMVDSPVNIQASAASAKSITGWIVYVDNVQAFEQDYGSSINTNVAMTPGNHSVIIRAWDSTGAYGSQVIGLTVQ
jgi:acid phosphatase